MATLQTKARKARAELVDAIKAFGLAKRVLGHLENDESCIRAAHRQRNVYRALRAYTRALRQAVKR